MPLAILLLTRSNGLKVLPRIQVVFARLIYYPNLAVALGGRIGSRA
jgi:hypothetical protein